MKKKLANVVMKAALLLIALAGTLDKQHTAYILYVFIKRLGVMP